jgi:hypothetical protein
MYLPSPGRSLAGSNHAVDNEILEDIVQDAVAEDVQSCSISEMNPAPWRELEFPGLEPYDVYTEVANHRREGPDGSVGIGSPLRLAGVLEEFRAFGEQ